jgi:hypothetical protein
VRNFLSPVKNALAVLVLTAITAVAASSPVGAQASGAVSALVTYAPSLQYDGETSTGVAYSVAGDIALLDRWIGRAQFDLLQASSLEEPLSDRVTGGWALVGSLGRRLGIPGVSRLHLDVLASGGIAMLDYTTGGNDFSDASPQFGVTIAPHVGITDRLDVTFSLRHLQGADVGEGKSITRTDLGFGARLRIF